jgi:probable addiction module antidote protein
MKTEPFDPAAYIETEEDVISFLDAAMEGGDTAHIATALGVIARSKGMTEIANKSGIKRQALYHALSDDGNPTLATFTAVLNALGLRLRIDRKAA